LLPAFEALCIALFIPDLSLSLIYQGLSRPAFTNRMKATFKPQFTLALPVQRATEEVDL
jgi:hypothetical protein